MKEDREWANRAMGMKAWEQVGGKSTGGAGGTRREKVNKTLLTKGHSNDPFFKQA